MAGDWIKMRCNLADDPAVVSIAAATGLDEFAVVGRLHRLWSWAGEQSRDGRVASATVIFIDRYVCAQGFAQAMSDAGWLVIENGAIVFPKFDVHNSKSAKQRALNTARASRYRRDDRRAAVTKKSPLEKRREEKRQNQSTDSVSPAEPAAVPRPRDELFDAIADVGNADPKVHGSRIGRACTALRKADPPYTAAEVRHLPAAIREHGLDFTLTVEAILKHIGFVRVPPKSRPPPRGGKREQFGGIDEFERRMQEPQNGHDPGVRGGAPVPGGCDESRPRPAAVG